MLYAANLRSVKKQMLSRGLFLFEATTPKPDLSTLTWPAYVKLCADMAVCSARGYAVGDTVPLCGAAGIKDNREYPHARLLMHNRYNSTNTGDTGSIQIVDIDPNARYLEKQFAVNPGDAYNYGMADLFRAVDPYAFTCVHGYQNTELLTSVNVGSSSDFNSTYVGKMLYRNEPGERLLNAQYRYANGVSGTACFVANQPADVSLYMKYAVVYRTYTYQASSSFYSVWPNAGDVYFPNQAPNSVKPAAWGMSAFIDQKGVLSIALLPESDFVSINPLVNSQSGTAVLDVEYGDQYVFSL